MKVRGDLSHSSHTHYDLPFFFNFVIIHHTTTVPASSLHCIPQPHEQQASSDLSAVVFSCSSLTLCAAHKNNLQII